MPVQVVGLGGRALERRGVVPRASRATASRSRSSSSIARTSSAARSREAPSRRASRSRSSSRRPSGDGPEGAVRRAQDRRAGHLRGRRARHSRIMSTDEVKLKRALERRSARITENDVMLAKASEAIVRRLPRRAPITAARRAADSDGVDIRTYTVIYELSSTRSGTPWPGCCRRRSRKSMLGRAEVLSDRSTIPKRRHDRGLAGRRGQGSIKRNAHRAARARRRSRSTRGMVGSLRRFKDDTCARFAQRHRVRYRHRRTSTTSRIGDIIEVYEVEGGGRRRSRERSSAEVREAAGPRGPMRRDEGAVADDRRELALGSSCTSMAPRNRSRQKRGRGPKSIVASACATGSMSRSQRSAVRTRGSARGARRSPTCGTDPKKRAPAGAGEQVVDVRRGDCTWRS